MERTISGLTAANTEAKNYLQQVSSLRVDNAQLEKQLREANELLKQKQKALEGCDRLCGILIEVIAFYQGAKS